MRRRRNAAATGASCPARALAMPPGPCARGFIVPMRKHLGGGRLGGGPACAAAAMAAVLQCVCHLVTKHHHTRNARNVS